MSERESFSVKATELEKGIGWLLQGADEIAACVAVLGLHGGSVLSENNAAELHGVGYKKLTEAIRTRIDASSVQYTSTGDSYHAELAQTAENDMQCVLRSLFCGTESGLVQNNASPKGTLNMLQECKHADVSIATAQPAQPSVVRTNPDELCETEGVQSSSPNVSNDFVNASFLLHQLDCRSDCTDSTGIDAGAGLAALGTGICGARRRFRSLDTTYSEISNAEGEGAWDTNSSLFNTLAPSHEEGGHSYFMPSPSLSPIPRADQDGTEPVGTATEGSAAELIVQSHSSSAPTVSNMRLSQSRSGGVLGGLSASQHSSLQPEEEEDDQSEAEAAMGTGPVSVSVALTSPSQPAVPPTHTSPHPPSMTGDSVAEAVVGAGQIAERGSQDGQHGSPNASVEARAMDALDVLVLFTLLPRPVRSSLHAAFTGLGVEVRREHSTATALVTYFLGTAEGRRILLANDGYARILVVETAQGLVSVTVVAVESPLRADLGSLNHSTASVPNSAPASTFSSSAELASAAAAAVTPRSDVSTAGDTSTSTSTSSSRGDGRTGEREEGPCARSVVLRVEHCVWSPYTVAAAGPGLGDTTAADGLRGEGNTSRVSAEEAMRNCIETVMAHQAVLHNPFPPSPTVTLGEGRGVSSALSPPPLERRRFHSQDRDARLFGSRVAVRLHEANSDRVDAAASEDDGPTLAREYSAASPPVPVLNAVLVCPEGRRHHEDQQPEGLLWEVEALVVPYLRCTSDRAQPGGQACIDSEAGGLGAGVSEGWLDGRSQFTVEGSFVAVQHHRIAATSVEPDGLGGVGAEAGSHAAPQSLSNGAVFLLPSPAAVQRGAWTLAATRPDALRVFECTRVTRYCPRVSKEGRLSEVGAAAVGILVRRCGTTGHDSSQAEEQDKSDELRLRQGEQIIWMNPDPTIRETTVSANYRGVREHCLALCSVDTSPDGSTVVQAVPCRLSRRTYSLKPRHTVTAFVQHAPRDAACIVQPFTATYTVQMEAAGRSAGKEVYPGLVVGSVADEVPATPNGMSGQCGMLHAVGAGLARLYHEVCQVIHYLIFPGTTYYIQYYQADYVVPRNGNATTHAGQCCTVAPAASLTAQDAWELLVVVETPPSATSAVCASEGERKVCVVERVRLPSAPTHCDTLTGLEQSPRGQSSDHTAPTTGTFPSCVVSLSADHATRPRVLTVKKMTAPQHTGEEGKELTATHISAKPHRRGVATPMADRRHLLELTDTSYALLHRRAVLQRRVQLVRIALRVLGLLVAVGFLTLCLLVLLVDDRVPDSPSTIVELQTATQAVRPQPMAMPAPAPTPASALGPEAAESLLQPASAQAEAPMVGEETSIADWSAHLSLSANAPYLSQLCFGEASSGSGSDRFDSRLWSAERTNTCTSPATDWEVLPPFDQGAGMGPDCNATVGSAAEAGEDLVLEGGDSVTPLPPPEHSSPSAAVPAVAPQPRRLPYLIHSTRQRDQPTLVSSGALHHLMTQYQLRQQEHHRKYAGSGTTVEALPEITITQGQAGLQDRFRLYLEVLIAQLRTQGAFLNGLIQLAAENIWAAAQLTEARARQLAGYISKTSERWARLLMRASKKGAAVLAMATRKHAPWLVEALDSEPVRHLKAETLRRARELKRSLRRAAGAAGGHIQTTQEFARRYCSALASAAIRNALPLIHAADTRLNAALVALGRRWAQAQQHMCEWRDRAAVDMATALRAVLRGVNNTIAVVFGRV